MRRSVRRHLFSSRVHCTDTLTEVQPACVFVTDAVQHCITALSTGGQVIAKLGTGKPGYLDGHMREAQFCEPSMSVMVSPSMLLVADTGNGVIRRVDLRREMVSTVGGAGERALGGRTRQTRQQFDEAMVEASLDDAFDDVQGRKLWYQGSNQSMFGTGLQAEDEGEFYARARDTLGSHHHRQQVVPDMSALEDTGPIRGPMEQVTRLMVLEWGLEEGAESPSWAGPVVQAANADSSRQWRLSGTTHPRAEDVVCVEETNARKHVSVNTESHRSTLLDIDHHTLFSVRDPRDRYALEPSVLASNWGFPYTAPQYDHRDALDSDGGLQLDRLRYAVSGRGRVHAMPLLACGPGQLTLGVRMHPEQASVRVIDSACALTVEGSVFHVREDIAPDVFDPVRAGGDPETQWLAQEDDTTARHLSELESFASRWHHVRKRTRDNMDQHWFLLSLSPGTAVCRFDSVAFLRDIDGGPVWLDHRHTVVPIRILPDSSQRDEIMLDLECT